MDISNYRSLDFIGVSRRTSVSMALHFHMQNRTSIYAPTLLRQKRYCVPLACWRKAKELRVNRRPGREEGEGEGREGKARLMMK